MLVERRPPFRALTALAVIALAGAALGLHLARDDAAPQRAAVGSTAVVGRPCSGGDERRVHREIAGWPDDCAAPRAARVVGASTLTRHGWEAPIAAVAVTGAGSGDGAGGGDVLVTAEASVQTSDPDACPCHVSLRLVDATGDWAAGAVDGSLGSEPDELRGATTSLSTTYVFPIAAHQTKTFEVRGYYFDRDVEAISFRARISAIHLPAAIAPTTLLEAGD